MRGNMMAFRGNVCAGGVGMHRLLRVGVQKLMAPYHPLPLNQIGWTGWEKSELGWCALHCGGDKCVAVNVVFELCRVCVLCCSYIAPYIVCTFHLNYWNFIRFEGIILNMCMQISGRLLCFRIYGDLGRTRDICVETQICIYTTYIIDI